METMTERRSRLLKERELARLRDVHGTRLVSLLSQGLRMPFSLDDFRLGISPPWTAFWSGRTEDTPGLVAAYIDRDTAIRLLSCMERSEIEKRGCLGILNNEYIGICEVSEINLVDLLSAADLTNESVAYYPAYAEGAIVVDCYRSGAGEPYNVHCFRPK